MATYIPGNNEKRKRGTEITSKGEMIALVGTILCTSASALILIWRLIEFR